MFLKKTCITSGNKGDPGRSFNESRIHLVEKENKKLKKEVHRLENFTQELQGKYEKLETENTNLKNLVFKFMGGNKLITFNGFINKKCKTSKFRNKIIIHIKA